MAIAHVRKGDTVMVVAGKERGKKGKVLRVIPEKGRVVVERINMIKKHQSPPRRSARAASSSARGRSTSPT